MLLHLTRVKYIGTYSLQVTFNNGVTKNIDLREELDGEIFEPLKNIELFRQVKLSPETKTAEWPNGADFAPEFLYEIGQTEEAFQEQRMWYPSVQPLAA